MSRNPTLQEIVAYMMESGLALREIARRAACDPGTVLRVRDGKSARYPICDRLRQAYAERKQEMSRLQAAAGD